MTDFTMNIEKLCLCEVLDWTTGVSTTGRGAEGGNGEGDGEGTRGEVGGTWGGIRLFQLALDGLLSSPFLSLFFLLDMKVPIPSFTRRFLFFQHGRLCSPSQPHRSTLLHTLASLISCFSRAKRRPVGL